MRLHFLSLFLAFVYCLFCDEIILLLHITYRSGMQQTISMDLLYILILRNICFLVSEVENIA
jgi:hypothetical protein